MNKGYLVGLIFSMLSYVAYAQDVSFKWAAPILSTEYSVLWETGIDPQGNLFSFGTFDGSYSFVSQMGDSTFTASNQSDVIIQKTNSDGDVIWVKSIGGTNQYERVTSLDVDNNGNFYISGMFTNMLDLDLSINQHMIYAPIGEQHSFVAKYDNNGVLLWVKQIDTSNPNGSSFKSSLQVDETGNVYIIGDFIGEVDFDPSIDSVVLNAYGTQDMYIQKLDSSGNLEWVEQIKTDKDPTDANYTDDYSFSLYFDSYGNPYVTGTFSCTIYFNPGTGSNILTPEGDVDMYVFKMNALGDFSWAKQMGSPTAEVTYVTHTLDQEDNILVFGIFDGAVDFDPSAGEELYDAIGNFDYFVLKLDSSGNFNWVKVMESTGGAHSMNGGITTDNNNNVYTCFGLTDGLFIPNDLDTLYLQTDSSITGVLSEIVVLKLDSNGYVNWGINYGGSSVDLAFDILVDELDMIYITGYFNNDMDFDPNSPVYEVNATGDANGFLQKLNQCFSTTHEDLSVCDSLEWIDGNTYYESTESPIYTYFNTNGHCDSIIVLNLEITELTPTISAFGSSNIITEQTWDSYQWLDCDNDYIEIPQANAFLFAPTSYGNYAVQVEQNGCFTISECFAHEPISTPDILWSNVKVYPNPTQGEVTINLGNLDEVAFTVYDVLGKVVEMPTKVTGTTTQLNLIGNSGVYMIEISANKTKRLYRVIKL